MPRAKIPHDEIEAHLKAQYPYPAFHSINRTQATPKRVYMRHNGQYAPCGWHMRITGFRFISVTFDAMNMRPEYEYFSQKITIWIA